MEFGDKVNWMLTTRCNRDCSYCFKPQEQVQEESETIKYLAKKLTRSEVKKVTISGGEPLLVPALDEAVQTLAEGKVYVSLHTNGDYLTRDRIKALKPFVGDISIPVDSMYSSVQEELRGKDSLKAFRKAFWNLNEEGVKVGIHTVATDMNVTRLTPIYRYITKGNFDHWKVYEENERMAQNGVEPEFNGVPPDGDVDCLFANFLMAEHRMNKFGDKRVKFLANEDKLPYVFLMSDGQVSYGPWFTTQRKVFGNLTGESLKKICKRIENFVGGAEDSTQFFDGKATLPIWARLYEGNYWAEEAEVAESLPAEIRRKMTRLFELYADRDKEV